MKRILALVLSALTLVGGHFVNRRFDRAVVFFVALVVWSVTVYAYALAHMSESAKASPDLGEAFAVFWTVLLSGMFVLWLISLAFTSIDARRPDVSFAGRWTISAALGAVGLTSFTLAFLLAPFLPFLLDTAMDFYADSAGLSANASSSFRDRHFTNMIHLGRGSSASRELTTVPPGQGYLRGKVLYEGTPAPGVTLTLILNGKYESDQLTTDDNGIFTARVRSGEWEINRITTQEWADRPRGDFVVLTGTEPKLVDGRYNEHYWLEREGVRVVATDQPSEPQLTLTIRKRIATTWPKENAKRIPATRADGAIAWAPYPGAEKYLVRITELKREGQTTALYKVTTKTVTGATQLPLATLAAVPGQEEREYQVAVLAFAADGSLISESKERFDALSFVLTDKQQLVRDDDRAPIAVAPTAVKIDVARENARRLDAAETLTKEGMLVEAEKMLGKVRGQSEPGRKAAVTGYTLARRGHCADANKLFAKAQAEAGANVVPEYYRQCKATAVTRKR